MLLHFRKSKQTWVDLKASFTIGVHWIQPQRFPCSPWRLLQRSDR